MQVILQERVPKLGHKWDVVNVKNGYARNFLIPKSLAIPATTKLVEMAKKRQEERVKHLDELKANAQEMAKKLSVLQVSFTQKANNGKLYGSITEKDVADALMNQHKIEIAADMVKMSEHLKTVGEHMVKLHLAEAVDAELKVLVEEEK